MQTTLKPKQDDDPHDFLVVASDGVAVAPAREQAASLAPDAVRRPLDSQTSAGSGFAAAPPVRPVEATFRPAAVNDIPASGDRRWIARRIVRAVMAVLLTVGAAVIARQSYGDAAKQMIATWVPQSTLTSWLPLEKLGLAASPASPTAAPGAAQVQAPQAAAPAPAAPDASAPAAASVSADSAQLMQSMAHDLATVGQQIEQLKASIEQLKAGQDQLSRDVAKVSEKAAEKVARIAPPPPVVPPRPVVPRLRKPPPPYPLPQAAAAPAVPPPAAAPYYPPPRQIQSPPDAANAPPLDPELSSAPRPPMPLR
jgi:hypothetical protein